MDEAIKNPRVEEKPLTANERVRKYHPWRRYFARIFDLMTLGTLGAVILGIGTGILLVIFLGPEKGLDVARRLDNQLVNAMLMVLAWLPLETFCLTMTGTTPGKWIFGIKVKSRDGHALGLDQSLKRSWGACWAGLALGIPIASLATVLLSYYRLINKGSTNWDDSAKTEVEHSVWNAGRAMAAVACILAAVVFQKALETALS